MRSEVFLRENIVAIIQGVAAAHGDLAIRLSDRDAALYSAGFAAALRAISAALGVGAATVGAPPGDPRPQITVDSHADEIEGVVIRFSDPSFPGDHEWSSCREQRLLS